MLLQKTVIRRIFRSEISLFRYNRNEDSQNHDDHHSHEDMKWGWGDVDMNPEEIQEVDIINKGD